jgi:hypothetical protein
MNNTIFELIYISIMMHLMLEIISWYILDLKSQQHIPNDPFEISVLLSLSLA